MKHRKIAIIVGIVFVLICIALYIFIYTIPELTGSLKPTTVVNYGEMRISKKLPAVVVRKEAVHDADCSGNATYYISNNTKTRKNTTILDVYNGGEKNAVKCPATGVVSYYYDGYESKINFESIDVVDNLIPTDGTEITISEIKTDRVNIGDHVYKLITSDTWYVVAFVPTEELNLFEADKVVTLVFETGSVTAKIDHLVEKEGTSLVVFSTSKYYKDFDKIRLCDVEIVLQDDKGLIIPNTAIATVDGEPGVYVKKIDGSYTFTRIEIINSNDIESVVTADRFGDVATISIYDEILKNASEQN